MPAGARCLDAEGGERTVAAVDLMPGERVRVRPGEIVPADGVVREGYSSFDESLLTGEAQPVQRGPGGPVRGGARNHDQPVVIEVVRSADASTVAQIQRLVGQAMRTRPPAAALAERAVPWFVGAVLLTAAATLLVWLWLDAAACLSNTIAVLIVTCPCALALATPVAISVAAGRFARGGVLPVRMTALDALANADVVALDKTGTLTWGCLRLVAVERLGDRERAFLQAVAGALEGASEHPIARALRRVDSPPLAVKGVRNLPGGGVSGIIDGVLWRLGTPEFVLQGRASSDALRDKLQRLGSSGHTVVLLGAAGEPQALFALRDEVRPGAEEALRALERGGIRRLAVLSGDSAASVHRLASSLRVGEAVGALTPEDKLAWIKLQQAEGRTVLMVGDGVNDAPTLAAADVSLSFEGATDLAQSQSDFIITGNDLRAIPMAIQLARKTRNVVRGNLFWAVGYNLTAVPAAAFGLVPPWAAALGMAASSLLVVANSLRLRGLDSISPQAPGAAAARSTLPARACEVTYVLPSLPGG